MQKRIKLDVLSEAATHKTNEGLDATISLQKNGKSFYWASHFLGREMSKNAAKLYSYCRILDDLADSEIEYGPDRLRNIHLNLKNKKKYSDPLLNEMLVFFVDMNLPFRALKDLIEGLLQDQNDVLIKNEAELIQYSYHVAGTVGWMMCPILKCRNKKAFAFAVDLGIAMQLTNIARDVREDACMGRRYLPSDWVNDMSPTDILEASKKPNSKNAQLVKKAIIKLLCLADQYYRSGVKGLVFLPWKAHLAIGVAGCVYQKIGTQLIAKKVNWHDGRTVTSSFAKILSSCGVFPLLFSRFLKPPKHDAKLHQYLSEKLDML